MCTVGGTSVHGYFTAADLMILFELCPSGSFTPTFYHEHLPAVGYGREGIERVKVIESEYRHSSVDGFGFYFTFMEADGEALLTYLRNKYPMIRGE